MQRVLWFAYRGVSVLRHVVHRHVARAEEHPQRGTGAVPGPVDGGEERRGPVEEREVDFGPAFPQGIQRPSVALGGGLVRRGRGDHRVLGRRQVNVCVHGFQEEASNRLMVPRLCRFPQLRLDELLQSILSMQENDGTTQSNFPRHLFSRFKTMQFLYLCIQVQPRCVYLGLRKQTLRIERKSEMPPLL